MEVQWGVRLQVKNVRWHVVQSARDGVDTLDELRRAQGISQMKISDLADTPDVGQQYARMYRSGDVTLSKFLKFLRSLGWKLVITRDEEGDA